MSSQRLTGEIGLSEIENVFAEVSICPETMELLPKSLRETHFAATATRFELASRFWPAPAQNGKVQKGAQLAAWLMSGILRWTSLCVHVSGPECPQQISLRCLGNRGASGAAVPFGEPWLSGAFPGFWKFVQDRRETRVKLKVQGGLFGRQKQVFSAQPRDPSEKFTFMAGPRRG